MIIYQVQKLGFVFPFLDYFFFLKRKKEKVPRKRKTDPKPIPVTDEKRESFQDYSLQV